MKAVTTILTSLLIILLGIANTACTPTKNSSVGNQLNSSNQATSSALAAGLWMISSSIESNSCSAAESTVILPKINKPLPVWYDSIKFAYGFYKKNGCTRCDDATWSSSKPEIATISKDGLLDLVKPGITTIKVSCGSSLTNSFDLAVGNESFSNFRVEPVNLSVKSGSKGVFLKALVTGKEPDESAIDITRKVQWSSSDEKIATIGSLMESGVMVTPNSDPYLNGTTQITAVYNNQNDTENYNQKAITNLKVEPSIAPIEQINLKDSELPVGASTTGEGIYYTEDKNKVKCGATSISGVSWTSSDLNTIKIESSVSAGYRFIALKPDAVVTLTLDCDGHKGTTTIKTLKANTLSVTRLDGKTANLHPFQAVNLAAKITASNGKSYDVQPADVTWQVTTNGDKATVSNSTKTTTSIQRIRFQGTAADDPNPCVGINNGCVHMTQILGEQTSTIVVTATSRYASQLSGRIELGIAPIHKAWTINASMGAYDVAGMLVTNDLSSSMSHLHGKYNQFIFRAVYTDFVNDGIRDNMSKQMVNLESQIIEWQSDNPNLHFDTKNLGQLITEAAGTARINVKFKSGFGLDELQGWYPVTAEHAQLEQCNTEGNKCFGIDDFSSTPMGVAASDDGNILYVVSSSGSNNYLIRYDLKAKTYNIPHIWSTSDSKDGRVTSVATNSDGSTAWYTSKSYIYKYTYADGKSSMIQDMSEAYSPSPDDKRYMYLNGIAINSKNEFYVVRSLDLIVSHQYSHGYGRSYLYSNNSDYNIPVTEDLANFGWYSAGGVSINWQAIGVATPKNGVDVQYVPIARHGSASNAWSNCGRVDKVVGGKRQDWSRLPRLVSGVAVSSDGKVVFAISPKGNVWISNDGNPLTEHEYDFEISTKTPGLFKGKWPKGIATDKTGTTIWIVSQTSNPFTMDSDNRC